MNYHRVELEWPASQFEGSGFHEELLALGLRIVAIWDNGKEADDLVNIVQYADDAETQDGYYLYDNATVEFMEGNADDYSHLGISETDNGDFFCCGETFTNWEKMYPCYPLKKINKKTWKKIQAHARQCLIDSGDTNEDAWGIL